MANVLESFIFPSTYLRILALMSELSGYEKLLSASSKCLVHSSMA